MNDVNIWLEDPLTPEGASAFSQKMFSLLVDSEAQRRLLESTTEVRELARLRCVAREGAGDWLGALPSKTLGLHLRRNEFVLAGKYRLGMRVFVTEGECPALGCRGVADGLGDHSLSCAIGGERIARHNHARDVLFQAAVQAGLAPVREAPGLLPGAGQRPTDVFLPAWANGKGACLDFTCTNPLQTATVARCAEEGAYAVEKAHNGKLAAYADRVEAEGLVCLPLAVDTFGGWHPEALVVITKLARQLARNVGRETGEQVRHLRQRLGVTLVKDNMAMLQARIPTFAPPEVDGDVDREGD